MRDFGIKEFYMQYCLDYRDTKITYKEYKDITSKIFKAIGKEIAEGHKYNIPKYLGSILVKEIKMKENIKGIDWVATKKNYAQGIKEIVRYTNSKNTNVFCFWDRGKHIFLQAKLYKFVLAGNLRKLLIKNILAGVKYTKR